MSAYVSTATPVVVVVLDTLRVDMVDRQDLLARLPAMRKLFRESYVFTRAYAPSHWTLPSHASLFTGLAPSEHMACPPQMKLREDVPTLAEIFRNEGYFTACITCNPWLSDGTRMTRGFDDVWMPHYKLRRYLNSIVGSLSKRSAYQSGCLLALADLAQKIATIIMTSPRLDNGARAAVGRLRHLLRRRGATPFLAVNLMEAHSPYYSRGRFAAWRKRIRHVAMLRGWGDLTFAVIGGRLSMTPQMRGDLEEIYWENVQYLDSQIHLLLRELPKGFRDNGFLIIVSDHGQLLGEKGAIDHQVGLAKELVRVPLVIRPPGEVKGKRINRLVGITSLFSLLTTIASGEPGAFTTWLKCIGEQKSIISEAHGGGVPYIAGRKRSDLLSRTDLQDFKAKYDHPALACIIGPWKLICHLGRRGDELYDVGADPREEANLVTREADVLLKLHEELRETYVKGLRGHRCPYGKISCL